MMDSCGLYYLWEAYFLRLVVLLELIILFHSFVKVIVRSVGFFKLV